MFCSCDSSQLDSDLQLSPDAIEWDIAVGFSQLVLVGHRAVSVGVSPVECDDLFLSHRRSFVKQRKALVRGVKGCCNSLTNNRGASSLGNTSLKTPQ